MELEGVFFCRKVLNGASEGEGSTGRVLYVHALRTGAENLTLLIPQRGFVCTQGCVCPF